MKSDVQSSSPEEQQNDTMKEAVPVMRKDLLVRREVPERQVYYSPLDRSEWVFFGGLLLVTCLALATRFYRITEPSHVAWDETHFGKHASWYIQGKFFFDVHPPLGKLIIAVAGVLTGYNGSFEFNEPGQAYGEYPYVGMRVVCAIMGLSVVPLAYLTVWELVHSNMASLLAGVLMICETGTLILSQYILLDPPLLCFVMLSTFCTARFINCRRDAFDLEWWYWLSLSGMFIGCAFSVKWVGLFIISLVGLTTIKDLWDLLGDLSLTMRTLTRHFFARVLCLICWPVVIYLSIFAFHFMVLNSSGNGDGFFSSEFQSTLIGNELYEHSVPEFVGYGSVITLKNCRGGGGLLHSHHHLYPEEYGEFQQQQGCNQVGKAISMPPSAVLLGLLIIVSFSMSHCGVQVEGTDWIEPVLLWISICMPTGSGKSSLCKYLKKLVDVTRDNIEEEDSSWYLDGQSFAKLGAVMRSNRPKLMGHYDELAMFLDIFGVKGVTDPHEFLQLCVSRDANSDRILAGLTLSGFSHPSVARNLLEQHASVEKGTCQRVLWFVPKPNLVPFDELEEVSLEFSTTIVNLMSALWRRDRSVRLWWVPRPCAIYEEKYDEIQEHLRSISCMDDLLSGLLSKSKGQILRVAAALHVLFNMEDPRTIPSVISEQALKAAIDLVDVCLQDAAFLAGRGVVGETIERMITESSQATRPLDTSEAPSNAAISLLLPGKVLHLNALLVMRKFRNRGNKPGAVRGFEELQESGLGKIHCIKPQRGASVMYTFEKYAVPEDPDSKICFVDKLTKFGISVQQYKEAYEKEDITMLTLTNRKRPAPPLVTTPRRSPRKNLEPAFSE